MSKSTETRIPLSYETRDLVKSYKRGGETYDELIRQMAEQYEPPRMANN